MRLQKYVLGLSILILLSSCIDEIKLDIDNATQRIAIDGLIADSLDTYTIQVFQSAIIGVGNDNVFEPISGASVKVLDDQGNSFDFVETEAGFYAAEMQGIVGRSYHTEIILADGTTIQSTPAQLNASPPIKEITSKIEDISFTDVGGNAVAQSNVTLSATTEFPANEELFLRWRALGVYEFHEAYPMAISTKVCYVQNNVDLNNLKIFDTRTIDGNTIEEEPFVTTKLDYRFAFQYAFLVRQYAMTEAEYKYWETVNDVISIDGSLFDPPPGTVRGNLRNINDPNEEIVGYFSVSGISTKRFFANPQSLNQVFIEPRCFESPFRPTFPECMDCTTILNSNLDKPDYWIP